MERAVEILFDAFPKQLEFLDCVFSGSYDIVLYGGAIRGGKTYAGLIAIILLACAYPQRKNKLQQTETKN